MDLKDVKAVVTGGASGLGEACVRMLAGAGAKAAIFDMAVDRGEKLAAELGKNVIFVNTDVTNDEGVQSSVARAVEAFGTINGAINCAGVGAASKVFSKKGPYPLKAFNWVVQINLIGTFNVIRLAVEQMVKNPPNAEGERGVIVNTASAAAFDGQIGQAAYAASKGGVVSMTLPAAREFARSGIRVVTIAPGLFDTPMFDQLPPEAKQALAASIPFPSRLGRPDEFGALARHVVENAMLNGETVRLDGALRMPPK